MVFLVLGIMRKKSEKGGYVMKLIEVSLTSFLSVAALFLIAKIMGHKQISQLDFFDYVTGITIGSVAAELATELETPERPLIAMIIYGASSVILNLLAHKIPKTRKYINGTPTIVMQDGKLYRKNIKKCNIDLSEFMLLCREQGYFNLNEISTAIFECNGKLSILPLEKARPLKPEDVNICPKQKKIDVEVIMDGRIMGENLTRLGLDEKWLRGQLKVKGYESEKEIFLGVLNDENQLRLYSNE